MGRSTRILNTSSDVMSGAEAGSGSGDVGQMEIQTGTVKQCTDCVKLGRTLRSWMRSHCKRWPAITARKDCNGLAKNGVSQQKKKKGQL